MGSVYQFRTFKQILTGLTLDQDQSFADIYLQKRGHTSIGIKFRQPKAKNYGWKLSSFQCKVAQSEDHGGVKLEKWRKYLLALDETMKLKVKSSKNKMEEGGSDQEESQDQQHQHKLVKKALKIHKNVAKVLLKSNIAGNKIVQDWCSPIGESKSEKQESINTQLQIFVITKDKVKAGGKQIGKLIIQRLINCPKTFYYQTECTQGKNPHTILNLPKQTISANRSYPKLLNQLAETHKEESPRF